MRQGRLNVVTLEHAPFEGPGSIEGWVRKKGASMDRRRLYTGHTLPGLDALDLLICMGGPMSVSDRVSYPWIASEIALIADAVDRGIPVLGVCLGAQLVAAALGARVFPAPEREIGWHAVRGTAGEPGAPQALALPESLPLFHWHGETFDLPRGASLLASSEACPNQVFSVGRRVLGVQCHPEMTPEGAWALVRACPADLAPGKWVQSAPAIAATPAAWYTAANRLADTMLDYLMEV